MPLYTNEQLYTALKGSNIVPDEKLVAEYEAVRNIDAELGDKLIEADLIKSDVVGRIISDLVRFTFVDLRNVGVQLDALNSIPRSIALEQKVVAFERDTSGLKIAMSNPLDSEFVWLLEKKTGERVQVFYATKSDIIRGLNLYKKELQESFQDIISGDFKATDVVERIIRYAYENDASDIHIEPEVTKSLVRIRVDGVLHDILDLPKAYHDQIVTKIKIASALRIDEHMGAQDGKLQLKLEKEDLDVRVSVVPIVNGEKCVLRLLSSKARKFTLDELGMNENDLRKMQNAYVQPDGMILVTGPTGSGKTTSIYGILKILNTRDVNIATIEDPVEYDISGINQIQVSANTNLTFATGLRAILRQDPDIIFVGEIRDEDTANIAVNAAMTGHLVLSTLHTNDAPTTLPRLLDMGIQPFLVATTVNVIIAQRLVRKVCSACSAEEKVDLNQLHERFPSDLIDKYFKPDEYGRVTTYRGAGCRVCHKTGYSGRIGVFEVLEVSPAINKLIIDKADSYAILNKAIEEGMTTMVEDGLQKASQGMSTIEEIYRVTRN